MKQLLVFAFLIFLSSIVKAQAVSGPAERKLTDSICKCMTKVNVEKITSKDEAVAVFTKCFAQYPNLLLKTAEERKAEITDVDAMHAIGIDVGKNLMRENCSAFMQISAKMAQSNEGHVSYGKLARINTKGLNYFIITDANGKEESFVWLHQFAGSSAFINGLGGQAGKRVAIKWVETEIYLPDAKGYFNVKEVTALNIQ